DRTVAIRRDLRVDPALTDGRAVPASRPITIGPIEREAERERRTLTGLGAHADLPAVGEDDLPGEGQPDPVPGDRALPCGAGAVVLREQVSLLLGGHPDPGIGHA